MRTDALTKAEMADLRSLAARQQSAHQSKAFNESDSLRAELMEYGAWPPERGWHPVFESPNHRAERLRRRLNGIEP